MSLESNKVFSKLIKAKEKLEHEKSSKDAKELIKRAEKNIKLAEQYVEQTKAAMEAAKKKMIAAESKMNHVRDNLDALYFDIETEATDEEKQALEKVENNYKEKSNVYFQKCWLYEGNDNPQNKTTGAIEILQQEKQELTNIKMQARPKKAIKADAIKQAQAQNDMQALIKQNLARRRKDIVGDKKTDIKKQELSTPQKLDLSAYKKGDVGKLFAKRAQSPSPTPPPLPPRDIKRGESLSTSHKLPPLPPRDSPPIPPREGSKATIIQAFLKEMHFRKGISLEKRITATQKKSVKFSQQQERQLNMAQAIIDLLYQEENKSPDEKGEILAGLMLNLKQQITNDKHSPLKSVVDEMIVLLQPTGYLSNANQMPLMAFMESKGLKQSDPKTFEVFLLQSQKVTATHKSPPQLFRNIRTQENTPDTMKKYETGIKLFNQFLRPFVTPESFSSKSQIPIRKRYEALGGSHNKRASLRESQIDLLQTVIDTLHKDNSYSGEEKTVILSGVLENFQRQLEGDKRNSKLFKVVNDLYKPLQAEAKNHATHQAGLLYISTLKLEEKIPKGMKAFNDASEQLNRAAQSRKQRR